MRKIVICLFLACVLAASGCGYGSTASYGGGMGMNPPATMMFNAMLNTGDAVNDQILKFEITLSSVTLTGVSPTPTTSNLLSKPAEVEFVHEAGTFEPLAVINLPAGTYSGASTRASPAGRNWRNLRSKPVLAVSEDRGRCAD